MNIFTRDRNFFKQDEIDTFISSIWSERYYGDGDFELSVPATPAMLTKLPKGQIMACEGSDIPMILETRDIQDGVLKVTGIDLVQWLVNRTIRTTDVHKDKEWLLTGYTAGHALSIIVASFCINSGYLDGSIPIGIPSAQTSQWAIPGLISGGFDDTGPAINFSIPFGPVYDALKQIAETYEVGMKITLDGVYADHYILSFTSYRGADRTSDQATNPVVRFSPAMDSFTNIHDLESITDHRNRAYIFASNADPTLITAAGYSSVEPTATGFDLKVFQGFADDTPDTITDSTTLINVLNQKAAAEITNHKVVGLVDGEIVPNVEFKYGEDFFLGDVVEFEGNTGTLQNARITEYIRAQDSAGERAYPTLAPID